MSDDHNADEPSATDDSTDSVNRRRFVKSLGVAGGTTVGLAGVGAAKTQSGEKKDNSPNLEIMTADVKTAQETLNERAGRLLKALAADGHISEASASSFPSYPLSSDKPGGVGRHRVEATGHEELDFEKQLDQGRLSIILPERGRPIGLFTPTDRISWIIYSITDNYEGEKYIPNCDVASSSVGSEAVRPACGGCICKPALRCILGGFRKTVCRYPHNGTCRTLKLCGC